MIPELDPDVGSDGVEDGPVVVDLHVVDVEMVRNFRQSLNTLSPCKYVLLLLGLYHTGGYLELT